MAGQVIVEFQVLGESVKVTALDVDTLKEVSMVGPASYPRNLLARQAIKKLNYVMARENNHGGA